MRHVFEADAYSWVKHLRAAGAFIRNYMQKCKAPDTATRMLFDIFLYHNALALISTKQSELFMDIYTDNKWCALQGQRTAFLASVDTLLSLVARLSIFATQSDTYSSDDERNLHLSAIRRELQLWFPPEGICDDARHTAEAMRHAALLYHYQIASTDDASKAITRSYRAIIRHIGQVSVSSPSVASHVWPLYMAGTTCQEVTGGDDRTFIRDRLSQMRAFRSIKSIDRVRETLEQRWADPRVGSNAEAPLILF
ncbi:hypothetical protein MAP00_004238 [Monascus purpureus]|nr:hypothetical protein MAP00_004238 [Monascus purpureus]